MWCPKLLGIILFKISCLLWRLYNVYTYKMANHEVSQNVNHVTFPQYISLHVWGIYMETEGSNYLILSSLWNSLCKGLVLLLVAYLCWVGLHVYLQMEEGVKYKNFYEFNNINLGISSFSLTFEEYFLKYWDHSIIERFRKSKPDKNFFVQMERYKKWVILAESKLYQIWEGVN